MMIKKSETLSLIITLSLWLIFTLCSIFVPIPQKDEKEKYISVKLSLPPVEKIEKQTEKIEKPVREDISEISPIKPEVVEKVEVIEKTEVVAKTEPVKTEPVKTEPVKTEPVKTEPVKTEPVKTENAKVSSPKQEQTFTPAKQQLQKSTEELIAEQNAKKSTKTVEDVDFDAMFGGSSTVSSNQTTNSSNQPIQTVQKDSNALSGSAGIAASTTTSSYVASSENQKSNDVNETNTGTMLSNISRKKYETTTQDLSSVVEISGIAKGDGGTLIQLENGEMRILLYPKEPEIVLPEDSNVETSVNIEIYFQVLKNGSVTSIQISNEALISPKIATEIKNQIAQWRFNEANSNGQGRLNCSIIKK